MRYFSVYANFTTAWLNTSNQIHYINSHKPQHKQRSVNWHYEVLANAFNETV